MPIDFGAGATCPVQRATFLGFDFMANVACSTRASDQNMAGPAESHAEVVYDYDINFVTTTREPSAAARLVLPADNSKCDVPPVLNRDATTDAVEEGTDANDASFGVRDNVKLPLPATCASFCPRELRASPLFPSFDRVASAIPCARPVARARSFDDVYDDARVLHVTNEHGDAAEPAQTAVERAPSLLAQWVDEYRSGTGPLLRRARAIAAWGNASFALPADYSSVTRAQPLPTALQEKKRAKNS